MKKYALDAYEHYSEAVLMSYFIREMLQIIGIALSRTVICLGGRVVTSRKHTYLILTPFNPTFI